jgi:hypothetical protein
MPEAGTSRDDAGHKKEAKVAHCSVMMKKKLVSRP